MRAHILVPLDGSPASLAALDHALALADEGDCTVELLHVEPPETLLGTPSPEHQRELDHSLEDAFRRAYARLGDRVTRRTLAGDPMRTIVETAREGHHDLIVIGTHGRVGRIQALLGSVAAGVVRNAPCPVLTVRELGAGYESFAERRHAGRPSVADQ
jgi:nucleotide-binding universal stress UspA family protein